MLKIIVLYIGAILYYGLCVHYLNKIIKKKSSQKSSRKKSSVLFNASVTENAVPAREVFKTLEDAGIKPNYLGK